VGQSMVGVNTGCDINATVIRDL
ncbi:uncharacterized protein METZ01_LOCUS350113, partial [marine metagenome]